MHLLLWNTECLFCEWFKPISTWTFPSATIAGGKRKRRNVKEPVYNKYVQNIFTYHSLPLKQVGWDKFVLSTNQSFRRGQHIW